MFFRWIFQKFIFQKNCIFFKFSETRGRKVRWMGGLSGGVEVTGEEGPGDDASEEADIYSGTRCFGVCRLFRLLHFWGAAASAGDYSQCSRWNVA